MCIKNEEYPRQNFKLVQRSLASRRLGSNNRRRSILAAYATHKECIYFHGQYTTDKGSKQGVQIHSRITARLVISSNRVNDENYYSKTSLLFPVTELPTRTLTLMSSSRALNHPCSESKLKVAQSNRLPTRRNVVQHNPSAGRSMPAGVQIRK